MRHFHPLIVDFPFLDCPFAEKSEKNRISWFCREKIFKLTIKTEIFRETFELSKCWFPFAESYGEFTNNL